MKPSMLLSRCLAAAHLLLFALALPTQLAFLHDSLPFIPLLEDATVSALQHGLRHHHFTSQDLVQVYLNRISVFTDIRATLELNREALPDAARADLVRQELGEKDLPPHLPLLGIPFIVKDNIAIPPKVGPTTAGSYALIDEEVVAPAKVVQRLLDAGAVLLATGNMDEMAQGRRSAKGDHPWGWSARGGQMQSIYGTSKYSQDVALAEGYGDVCGSSGGSALSVALGLAAFALGTQTGGVSVVCPSSRAGVVGFKPGRNGMVPMEGVIPISKHLDVVGPITRTVADAELVWRVIKHPKGWYDPEPRAPPFATAVEDRPHPRGGIIRVGVPRKGFWDQLEDMPEVLESVEKFVETLAKDQRFEVVAKDVVNITAMTDDALHANVSVVTAHDLKTDLNHYLETWTVPSSSPTKIHSLKDIIAFNVAHRSLELPPGPFPAFQHPPRDDESYSDQSFLLRAQSLEVAGWENATYHTAREVLERVGWTEGLEPYFWGDDGVDVLLVPTEGISGGLASVAAVPQITLPLDFYPSNYSLDGNATWPLYPYPDMPFGVSLMASRGHDSHEFLLDVAAKVESLLPGEGRRDRMRESVRSRLVALAK